MAAALRSKGFEAFLPLYKRQHRWSDRAKVIEEPLFPGYVFCRFNAEDRLSLLTIPGVMHAAGIGNVPTALADAEILAVREALRAEAAVEPWPFQEMGQRIRLGSGPLQGLEGFLVGSDDRQRIVLGLTVLKESVAVEIDGAWIDPEVRSLSASRTE